MNSILSDNKVQSLKQYLLSELQKIYDERESRWMTHRLFQHFFQWNPADLILHGNERISESEILKFHFALKRLKNFEPFQYVLGYQFFRGLEIGVNPGVLIPRPETEELVQWILDDWKDRPAFRAADLCSGSGCIALALKNERPLWSVSGFEFSSVALKTSENNAESLKLSVDFFAKDVLHEDLPTADIIISNPPYIPHSDRFAMHKNVLEHEPEMALFVDDGDPLIFYRRIIDFYTERKERPKAIYFEVHEGSQPALIIMLHEMSVTEYEFKTDLQNKIRFLKITM